MLELGQHGQRYPGVILGRIQGNNAIPDVLPPQNGGVAAAQTGIEEDVEHYPFPGASRPAELKSFYFIVRPDREALGFQFWDCPAGGWIRLGDLGAHRPFEQPAHGIDEMAGLGWRLAPPIDAGLYRLSSDLGEWFGSCRLEDVPENILSLPAGGSPAAGFPILSDQPSQCPRSSPRALTGVSPAIAAAYSALKSSVPYSARIRTRGMLFPTRTYHTALPCRVSSR